MLGYLLPVATGNATITYGRIAEMLQRDMGLPNRIFSTHIGGVVGTLMDRLHELDNTIPLINVLVVSQNKRRPGIGIDGYLRNWFGVTEDPLESGQKDKLVADASREVYSYRDWPKVYRRAFGSPAPSMDPISIVKGTEQDGNPPAPVVRHGGAAESPEHKALKAYVLAHPACVDIKGQPDSRRDELLLLSGDEVDVFFETGTQVDLVEVKSARSGWQDLQRGVYQCVKYRAVFQAQRQSVTPDMLVVATLVMDTAIPSDIQDLADLLKVRLKVVRVPKVRSKLR